MELDEMPVIKASASYRVLVDAEAQAANQVQGAVGCCTNARDISGVRRDLRLHEHDIEGVRKWWGAQALGSGSPERVLIRFVAPSAFGG